MNRTRSSAALKVAVLAGALAVLQLPAVPAFCQSTPPELFDDFSTDPHTRPWTFVGPFVWGATYQRMNSTSTTKRADLYWTTDQWETGAMSARVRLTAGPTGYPPKAMLIFARDPATNAYRYVQLAAGRPGTIVLGQSGRIGGLTGRRFRTVKATLPARTWLNVSVDIAPDATVTVSINGIQRLSAKTGTATALGQVGFAAAKSKISVDDFRMGKRKPNVTNCIECHDGRNPNPDYALAPDVYTYWDGGWWDTNAGGTDAIQQGGHGDPDGAVALDCTGAYGCHDMTTAAAAAHLDGVLGGRGNTSANTYHLKPEFFTLFKGSAAGEYAVQVAVDNYCYLKCHSTVAPSPVANHRHERDSWGPDGKRGTADDILSIPPRDVVELGTHITYDTVDLIMDSDVNNSVAGGKNFAPCVACHDPHGTGSLDTKSGSNRMLRFPFISGNSPLCITCHR